MKGGLMDNGSEIYSPDKKCPFCDDDTQDLKIGRNVCKLCEGKFRIEQTRIRIFL